LAPNVMQILTIVLLVLIV